MPTNGEVGAFGRLLSATQPSDRLMVLMITTEFLASAMQIVLAALRSTTACASTLGCLI